ncbi:MAG TPA: hypothetical protein VK004_02845 [Ignavibacteria bacterium]|nr:hypothetical protein [Ignavibacteria bacterium]
MSDQGTPGVPPTPPPPQYNTGGATNAEDLNIGLKILSFCIPLAGAIIYFVKKDKEPVAAKSACTWALVGFGLGIVINVIVAVLNN